MFVLVHIGWLMFREGDAAMLWRDMMLVPGTAPLAERQAGLYLFLISFTLSLPLWAHSLWTVWHGRSYSDRPAVREIEVPGTHDRLAGAGPRRHVRHDPGPAQPHLARLHLLRVLGWQGCRLPATGRPVVARPAGPQRVARSL